MVMMTTDCWSFVPCFFLNVVSSFLLQVYTTDAVSPNLRPPPYTDGTPNESVADVFVRVTQLMSILETQYFGDTIVIVSPDSDNLSVLQAGLIGLDLRRFDKLLWTAYWNHISISVHFETWASVSKRKMSCEGLIMFARKYIPYTIVLSVF